MAWVKIDDQFSDHPKVLEVGPLAECLFVRGLTYASRYLTDGFVPASHLRRMGDLNAIEEAGKLVASGLWHEADGGYLIHDYLDYQPSSEKVKADREAARERMGKARSGKSSPNNAPRSQEVRANFTGTSHNPVPSRPEPNVPNGTSTPKPPKQRESPAKPDRKRSEVGSGEQPFSLLESMCDALGVDVSELGESQKRKQLGVAKRLAGDGVTGQDIGRIVQWLRSQTWMTGGIDMFTIERNFAKWALDGKPASVPANGSLTIHRGGYGDKVGSDGLTDQERGWREDPGPKGWTSDEAMRMSLAMARRERERNSA